MPTVFKHALESQIGTVPTEVYTVPTGFRATVIGCNLANVTEYDTIVIDVYITEEETSTAAAYIKGLVIPPSTAVKLITNGEKLILTERTGVKIVSNTVDSLDVVLSYVEIS
jgi:hypothetical protein